MLEQMKMLLVIISHAENIKLHCPFEIQQKNFLHKNKSVESLYISEEASYIPASAPELAAAQFTY